MSALNEWVARHQLSKWEMCELLRELELIAPVRTVLEIGTHVGNSLRVWRECLDPELLIGVQDTDELVVLYRPEGTRFEIWDIVEHRKVIMSLPAEMYASMYHDLAAGSVYACADGGFITLGALEPQFYALLLDKLGFQAF